MKALIIYWSRYGNGKKVVDRLASGLKAKKASVKVLKTDEANPAALPQADIYIFSAPTEVLGIQKNMKKFMKGLSGMDGRKYGIINTHAMKSSRLPKMEKLLTKKGMVKVAEVDFMIGDGSESGDGLPEGWEATLDGFVKKL